MFKGKPLNLSEYRLSQPRTAWMGNNNIAA